MSRAFDFRGRVALIAGVGRRGQAGESIVAAFGECGARVLVIDRQAALAAERVADLHAAGVEAYPFVCDLTDAAAVADVSRQIAERAPEGLHALVHVAGGFAASGPVAESDPSVWHQQLAINATTAYLTTRACLPLVRQASGSIVYFASAAVLPGASVTNLSAYAAAKSAVVTLMRAVAAEERQHGVRANALAPTAIRTASNLESMSANTRYVERDTVANWVLHLTDPSSGPVSGQVIQLG